MCLEVSIAEEVKDALAQQDPQFPHDVGIFLSLHLQFGSGELARWRRWGLGQLRQLPLASSLLRRSRDILHQIRKESFPLILKW